MSLGTLLEWPGGIARLGAGVVVAVAVAVALGYVPRALRQLGDGASRNAVLSYPDRDIGGGNSIFPDQGAAYAARTLIPVHDTYRVVIGTHLTKSTPLTQEFADDWLIYFLMPRRPSRSPSWIVCVGCDPSALGSRYRVVWRDDIGISIGRLGQ